MNRRNYLFGLIIIGILYFIFGFVTWLNGTLIPFLKVACELSDFTAYLVTFAFYISYFVWALPSSWILKKTGFKNGIAVGLFVMAVGALLFIPAAYSRSYLMFLVALFILGSGLALMQTAVNPYVTILGPIESAAKRISIMGICNKVAGVLAPIILGAILLSGIEPMMQEINAATSVEDKEILLNTLSLRLVMPYTVMMIILILLGILVCFTHLPEVKDEEETHDKATKSIWKYPYLWFGVVAMFFYVGIEVIAGDTIIQYGMSLNIEQESAKYFTSLTLISMVVGYFVGVVLIPKYINQRQALIGCSVLGIILMLAAVFTPGHRCFSFPFIDLTTLSPIQMVIPYTVFFVALLGVANSLVWPSIWPLSLDGLGAHTKTGSALLIMSIAGGALLPLVYGKIAESVGTQQAYWIALPCYLVILLFAVFGCKMGKEK
ncbi:MAG: sugar MFS transporter [Bacteroidales bacterium]|nr:sugar MFS transporter [Bacteroidales bacterium]